MEWAERKRNKVKLTPKQSELRELLVAKFGDTANDQLKEWEFDTKENLDKTLAAFGITTTRMAISRVAEEDPRG